MNATDPALARPVSGAGAPLLSCPILSVVVPVRNEATNVAPLVAELRAALANIDAELV